MVLVLFCLIVTPFIYAHLRIVALICSVWATTCEPLPSDRNLKGDYFLEEERSQTEGRKVHDATGVFARDSKLAENMKTSHVGGREAERRGPYYRVSLVERETYFSTNVQRPYLPTTYR